MASDLKKRLSTGAALLNGWLQIPSGFSAELMALAGWDSITVDLQHGVQDYQSMVSAFQAIAAFPVTPLARIPWYDPGIIGKVLDAGAYGVICPMVNNKQDAQALVAACKYPPHGKRSNGPIRPALYRPGGAYQKHANDEVMVLPIIETGEAVENIDEILDVPGIDGIYVGPSDLAFSIGEEPRLDREEPKFLKIFDTLVAATRKRGLYPGMHCGSAAYAVRAIQMGFQLVGVMSDSALLLNAARGAVNQVREGSGMSKD